MRADKVRSAVALAARQKTGAGKHGGSSRAQIRRDRREAKVRLREERPART